tara:strand:+ start:1393 stop:1605 length:213 start_codon:yes stop_codon:yes gene_type:complete
MTEQKEGFDSLGFSDRVKNCLDVLSELPDFEKHQIAILLMASLLKDDDVEDCAMLMVEGMKEKNIRLMSN